MNYRLQTAFSEFFSPVLCYIAVIHHTFTYTINTGKPCGVAKKQTNKENTGYVAQLLLF